MEHFSCELTAFKNNAVFSIFICRGRNFGQKCGNICQISKSHRDFTQGRYIFSLFGAFREKKNSVFSHDLFAVTLIFGGEISEQT